MKSSTRVICFLFICLVFSSSVFAQANWVKYESNPVLTPGPAGSWDNVQVGVCSVIKDEGMYKMWYVGQDPTSRIGYAVSTDGINWTKYKGNPVLDVGPSGSWDSAHVTEPWVIKDGDVYKMWYSGTDQSTNLQKKIGYAVSPDGINWTKHPDIVMDLGPSGSWDAYSLSGHPVVKIDGQYHIWYVGEDYYGGTTLTGHAVSSEGIAWTKDADPLSTLLPVPGTWYEEGPRAGTVMYDGAAYKMWFSGYQDGETRIGYAQSADGIDWVMEEDPVLDIGPSGSWDSHYVIYPMVIQDGPGYKMFYTGDSTTSMYRVGLATDGPVAYWSFDNESDPGYDDSGNGHNGTLFGEGDEWSPNGLNCSGALDLDGEDDYLEVPYSSALDVNGWPEGTLSAWFKINSLVTFKRSGIRRLPL